MVAILFLKNMIETIIIISALIYIAIGMIAVAGLVVFSIIDFLIMLSEQLLDTPEVRYFVRCFKK